MGRTRDISLGGLFVESSVGLRVGTEVQVQMTLLNKHLSIPAEVVWALVDEQKHTNGIGLRFIDLAPAVRKTIEAFMALRHPMDFEIEAMDDESTSDSVDARKSSPTPVPESSPTPALKAPRPGQKRGGPPPLPGA